MTLNNDGNPLLGKKLRPERAAPPIGLVCVLVALPSIGVALTLPSLPTMRASFGQPVELIQLTISAYFLALALTQLVYGVLSDRFGRRPLLLASLAIFGAAGLACAFATDLRVLIALRALQGLGASGCMVLSRVIVGDVYSGPAAMRMMSIAMIAPSVVSLIGPLSGGLLLAWLGWNGVYAAIGIAGIATWAFALRYLPETIASQNTTATRPAQILRNLRQLLATPSSMSFVGIATLGSAAIYLYSSTSAFVLMEVFGVAPDSYGWFLAMTGLAIVTGSWTGGRLPAAKKKLVLAVGGIVTLVAAAALLFASLSPLRGPLGLVAIMLPMVVYCFCTGLFGPTCQLGVVHGSPGIAGMASAILGTFFMGGGAAFVYLGGVLYDGTPSALGIGVALAASAWVSLYFLVGRRFV